MKRIHTYHYSWSDQYDSTRLLWILTSRLFKLNLPSWKWPLSNWNIRSSYCKYVCKWNLTWKILAFKICGIFTLFLKRSWKGRNEQRDILTTLVFKSGNVCFFKTRRKWINPSWNAGNSKGNFRRSWASLLGIRHGLRRIRIISLLKIWLWSLVPFKKVIWRSDKHLKLYIILIKKTQYTLLWTLKSKDGSSYNKWHCFGCPKNNNGDFRQLLIRRWVGRYSRSNKTIHVWNRQNKHILIVSVNLSYPFSFNFSSFSFKYKMGISLLIKYFIILLLYLVNDSFANL